jgi:hypothetical protein
LSAAANELSSLEPAITNLENNIRDLENKQKRLLEYKKALNNLFYQHFSTFIKEGTWINEEYVDDEKYYNDALSVLYNSCYP